MMGQFDQVQAISCITGFVRDIGGNPLKTLVDLDLFDSTGAKLFTPGDNTSLVDGSYQICVLNGGFYRVTFAPLGGARLVGQQFFNFDLRTDNQLDVMLDTGVFISGNVTDSAGNALGEIINLNVDSTNGGRIYTPGDKSSIYTGFYQVVVPTAQYRLRYTPPKGSRWRAVQLDSVTITADTVIDIMLGQGVQLSGHVTDEQGLPLNLVVLDLRDMLGNKIFTGKSKTDTAGFYSIAVPTGMFSLRFDPPKGVPLAGALIDSLVITGDQVLDQVLHPAFLFTSIARDSAGNPLPGVNMDFKPEPVVSKIYTPWDKTDTNGVSTVAIPAATYTVVAKPPPGSPYDQALVSGVNVQGDMTMEFVLPEVSRVIWSGSVVDEFGIGLDGVSVDFRILLTGHRAFVSNNSTDSLGNFSVAVPTGTFNVLYTPPKGTRLAGHRDKDVSIASDTSVGTVTLSSGWFVRVDVSDPQGAVVSEVNLDFVSETLGEKIFTPRDITDQSGTAVVVIPTDTYTILATAPASSSLPVSTVKAVTISSDTTLSLSLVGGSGTDEGPIILKQNYPNPFNGSTIISYELKVDSKVSLQVYNLLGQHVKTLASGSQQANTYNIDWDGTNNTGQAVASGVYFYRLETSQAVDTRQMILVK